MPRLRPNRLGLHPPRRLRREQERVPVFRYEGSQSSNGVRKADPEVVREVSNARKVVRRVREIVPGARILRGSSRVDLARWAGEWD